MRALIAIAMAALLTFPGSSALAEKRIALVIGNATYSEAAALSNTRTDASDLAAALERLKFEVMQGLDLDKRSMERLIREFDRKLAGTDIALFFYAGHGLQVGGQNYLVPIDARLTTEADIDFESVPLSLILKRMEREAKTSIVLLDACRDNPLARNLAGRMSTRSIDIGRGLSRIEAAVGTLIGFSTQPGNYALDGDGRNSPYTRALLDEIEQPGREVLATLAAVRGKVVKATGGKQVPWEHTSLLGPVVLNAASEQYTGARSSLAGSPSYAGEASQMWQMIEKMEDVSVFEAFRKQFGASNPVYDQLAANKIARLKFLHELAALKVEEDHRRAKAEQGQQAALKAEENRKRAQAEQEEQAVLKAEEDRKRAQVEQERLAALKAAEERKRADAEQARLAALKAEEDTKRAQAERERLAGLKAEEGRKRAQAEQDQLATLKVEEERKRAKAEEERQAALKAEEDRRRAQAEQERLAALKAEEDRKRAQAEQERLAALKAEEDRRRAQAEQERIAALKAEEDTKRVQAEQQRLALLKADEERKRAQAEQERLASMKAEEDKRRKSEQQRLAALRADEALPKADTRSRVDEELSRRDPGLSIEAGSGQIFRDRLADGQPCAFCPELVVVPEGEFLMGSTAAEIATVSAERPDLAKYFNWEAPQRKVTIARKLAIGSSHVTRGEFAAFVASTGHKTEAGCYVHDGGEWKLDAMRNWRSPGFGQTDRHPVVCVSWTDANVYADWLSRLTGRSYQLLSEAEAEYAARATARASQMPRYYFGNDTAELCAYGNGANRTAIAALGWEPEQVAPCASGHVHTAPVASFKANPWGLHDVHGNAWSWSADCWNDNLEKAPTDGSARTTGNCARRVVRGGSWANGPRDLRSAVRDSNAIGERSGNLGFRLARELSY